MITNASDAAVLLSDKVSTHLTNSVNNIIFILQAIGVVIILFVIFWIYKAVSDLFRNHRIKKMYYKIEDMDKKIDILLEKSIEKKKR